MNTLPALVLELVEEIPVDLGGEDDGVALHVERLHIELPVEARMTQAPRFTAPRRRTQTGFDVPLARLTLGLWRRER